jgi:ribosomal protein L11 methyltransferase
VLRLAVRVRAEDAELVLAELLELAPSGVEEVELDGVVEYAVYGPPGELPELGEVKAAAGGALVEVSSREVPDDWEQRWREFHHPLVLGDRLTVRPPWEAPGSTSIDVVIDPGQAFGTGAHATTRLCLELLLELHPYGELVDLGCGSGVLAIVAAQLGFAPVRALDNDSASLVATAENAQRNGAALEIARHDLRSDPPASGATVTANLLGPLLRQWAVRLAMLPADQLPERVIASGLLTREAGEVAAAFAPLGLVERDRRERGEWGALHLANLRH